MPLFQASVLNSHLRQPDARQLEEAYHNFTAYFHNPVIQENIRNSKEEQFQASFLNELFVKVLGYTLNPNPQYNLTTEFRNESNNRKADGAILFHGAAVGVIELKGTNTKDLESIRRQAFDYKANQKGCVYVITSNFEKLRFYVNDATEFEEFNLFELGRADFELLYLCLQKENIFNNLPLKIKEASLVVEEEITKKFYSDYSIFKRELYQDLVKRNLQKLKTLQLVPVELESAPEEEGAEQTQQQEKAIKLNLFKKSQKLIDRFLFVFFAEDRNLLPPNSTMQILDKWKADMDFGDERHLYDLFRQYFGYLHTGRQSTASRGEIYAYNGGLFKPDEILDTVEIGSEMLYKHARRLASYDFESQVDVNILGHIFENSLNEIEGMTSEIEGTDFEKQKSKRKKDGVFYTPKYITKYIVENTVGKLCTEKKEELGFREEEYYEGRSKKHKKTILNLVKVLDDYRDWLLQLSICDPACGSGAFLNQALDFLIKEHRYIDELKTKLLGGSLVLSDIETTILENNIYGVDINEESVEIAKLSLWLRTAQPRRKLNDLSSNIKCGNSLIDDPAVAGEKAFKWEEEFPEIFARGGFDVVIGNPPYVQSHSLHETVKNYLYKEYITAEYQINTYGIFTEKILNILKDYGKYSIIIPNYWLSTKYDSRLRKAVFIDNVCKEILNVFSVFSDATVDTVIITGIRTDNSTFPKSTMALAIDENLPNITDRFLAIDNRKWHRQNRLTFTGAEDIPVITFNKQFELRGAFILGDFLRGYQGMKPYEKGKGTPPQTREMMNEKIYHSNSKIDASFFPLIGAKHVQRYYLRKTSTYIKFGINLAAPRKLEIFQGQRLLVNRILSREKIDIAFAADTLINNTDVFNLIPKKGKEIHLDYLLAILASKLCAFFLRQTNVSLSRRAFPKINVNQLMDFPIPQNINRIKGVDILIKSIEKLENLRTKFLSYILSNYEIEGVTRKLQNWQELEFFDFIKELNKGIQKEKGISLTKKEEFEWMDLFEENKKKAMELQQQIERTDREIDQMVYELYGLTEEEIKIIEQANG